MGDSDSGIVWLDRGGRKDEEQPLSVCTWVRLAPAGVGLYIHSVWGGGTFFFLGLVSIVCGMGGRAYISSDCQSALDRLSLFLVSRLLAGIGAEDWVQKMRMVGRLYLNRRKEKKSRSAMEGSSKSMLGCG